VPSCMKELSATESGPRLPGASVSWSSLTSSRVKYLDGSWGKCSMINEVYEFAITF
jgi:hypothetical protein